MLAYHTSDEDGERTFVKDHHGLEEHIYHKCTRKYYALHLRFKQLQELDGGNFAYWCAMEILQVQDSILKHESYRQVLGNGTCNTRKEDEQVEVEKSPDIIHKSLSPL